MNFASFTLPQASQAQLLSKPSVFGPWTLHEAAAVTSTNLLAAGLPPWTAVRADVQTAGRGRFQRTWISDAGGLWLSAVVPVPSKASVVPLLPMASGLAVCEALRAFGARGLHVRWPNDVLHGRRKLAGLLIDRFVPGTAVIGVGINVTNDPETCDSSLRGQSCRLADLVCPTPSLSSLMQEVLRALHAVWIELERTEATNLLARINALWSRPLRVQADLDGQIFEGHFGGVDAAGRLQLQLDTGQVKCLEPHEVRLLRELT